MAQHGDLQVRCALGNHAVVADIALHELGEPREVLLEAFLEALAVAQEGDVGEDQRLQRQHRLVADQTGARDAAQMARWRPSATDEAHRKGGSAAAASQS